MANAVPFVPRPFVGDIYRPSGRLMDYRLRAAQDEAEAIRQQGAIAAQKWAEIGAGVSGTLKDIAAYPDVLRQRQMEALRLQEEQRQAAAAQAAADEVARKRAEEQQKREKLAGLQQQFPGQRIPREALLQHFDPQDAAAIEGWQEKLFPTPKAPDDFTLNPGDVRFRGATGEKLAENPKPEPVKEPKYTQPMKMADGTYRQFVEGQIPPDAKFYVEPKAGKEPEKPSIWVSKGPDTRFVSPSEAAALSKEGWRSGNNREQGRPVTSGDAKDIADVNEALKLAEGLNFKPSDTGIWPSLGAAAPDFVTNLTGFGVGDKQRQGIINLVKQIIGKGLEGGVLRKEDETKYEKMLPKLGDHPDVVKSKVKNLISTLEQKRDTRFNALEDAGYDVSSFRKRGEVLGGGGNVTAVPDLAGVKPGMGRRFTDGPFKGQTWSIDANGKPFKVGS